MFYGSQTWDPLLITAQILTIQCIFYLTFGLALWILVGELEIIFQHEVSRFRTFSASFVQAWSLNFQCWCCSGMEPNT